MRRNGRVSPGHRDRPPITPKWAVIGAVALAAAVLLMRPKKAH